MKKQWLAVSAILLALALGWRFYALRDQPLPTAEPVSPPSPVEADTRTARLAVTAGAQPRPPGPLARPPPIREPLPPAPPGSFVAAPPAGAVPPPSVPTGVTPELDEHTYHRVDRDGLRAAMREAMPQLRECYEGWLRTSPGLAGRLPIHFTIELGDGGYGEVTQIGLPADAGMGHTFMEGCALAAVKALRFEPPNGGRLEVTYPVAFANTEPPKP